MTKKIPVTIICLLLLTNYLESQVLTVSAGSDLVITQNTTFTVDSLVLIPSADFTFSNLTLSRNITATHGANNAYIKRVYSFSNNTNPFTGSIQISYQDGAELNGLSENTLQLNVHDGVGWQAFNSATNDNLNNYVLTNSLSGIVLNELTLAASGFALPLQWKSFIATKQSENVLLQWSTWQEHNTKDFVVQTSTDGVNWKPLTKVAASGNSNSRHDYNYLHIAPTAGYNYYRIVETDADGRQNYSVVQKIYFEVPSLHIELMGNPVTNGILQIKISPARQNDKLPVIKLYTDDGKLLLTTQAIEGVNMIKVNGYAKGMYLLQASGTAIKFLIQ